VNNQSDSQLLSAYADQKSEPAFAELVRRYINLVYSAALRMSADQHLAEDVTQRTFAALAKKAHELSARPILSGWLHRTAQNIAAESIRTEVRRRAREHEAAAMNTTPDSPDARWEEIAPHLDAAVGDLSDPDRDAVLLRYFQNKSAREMAAALGITDEAAQKRVNRAVERLRAFFSRRGVTLSAASLAAISANAIKAAPAGLGLTISAAAAATSITTANIALQTMNWINAKSIVTAVVTAIAAGGTVYLTQKPETERLRAENQNLAALQSTTDKARDDAQASAKALQTDLDRLRKDQTELLRLRGEVAQLRAQIQSANTQPKSADLAAAAKNPRIPVSWAPGDYVLRDMLSPAGYDSPEAALQTTMYAMLKGTYEQANESLAPELLAAEPPTTEAKKDFEKHRDADGSFFKGLQILARKDLAEDKVEIKIKMDSDPNPAAPEQKTSHVVIQTMRKIEGAWKLGGSTRDWTEAWEKEGNVISYVK